MMPIRPDPDPQHWLKFKRLKLLDRVGETWLFYFQPIPAGFFLLLDFLGGTGGGGCWVIFFWGGGG
jgi:hypothetical protein